MSEPPPSGGDGRRLGPRTTRTARLHARRRRRALNVAVLVVLAVAVMVVGGMSFANLLNREEDASAEAGGTAASTVPRTRMGALLAVRQDSTVGALLLVDGRESGTLLAFPGTTIVNGPQGFARLSDLLDREQGLAAQGLGSLLQGEPGTVAETAWSDLRAAAVEAGASDELPTVLKGVDGARAALQAAAAVAAAAGTADGAAALQNLVISGDGAEEVRAALKSLPNPPQIRALLPGVEVGSGQAAYFEPDPAEIAVLLGLPAQDSGVSVEVQNGSGEVGIAEAVAAALQPLGFALLPAKNAEQFPAVTVTQILAASDALAQAGRVRDVLRLGNVVEQKDLPVGRIVVVVGGDLTAATLTRAAN